MQPGEMVKGTCCVDYPRGRGRKQALAQTVGQHERGDMIERERALEAVWRDLAPREHRSGIVEQDIDARLGGGNIGRGPLNLRKPQQIGIMDTVVCGRETVAQPRKRCLSALLVTGYHHYTRSHRGQRFGRGPAAAGWRTGYDAGFPLHACRAVCSVCYNCPRGEPMRTTMPNCHGRTHEYSIHVPSSG